MKSSAKLVMTMVCLGGGCGSPELGDEGASALNAAVVALPASAPAISSAAATSAAPTAGTVAAPVPTYDLQIIGPLEANITHKVTAAAINARGQVAGTAQLDDGQFAFRYQNCNYSLMPDLPSSGATVVEMEARDINDDGTIVGMALAAAPAVHRPFQSIGNATTDLDPQGSQRFEEGYAIGPSGIALGIQVDPSGTTPVEKAVYFLFGKAYPLDPFQPPTGGPLWVHSSAPGCRGGIRCGLRMSRSFSVVAAAGSFGVVSGGGFTGWSQVHGLGYANETDVLPEDINDNGHIVGSVGLGGTTRHAFWTLNPAGRARDMGVLHGGTTGGTEVGTATNENAAIDLPSSTLFGAKPVCFSQFLSIGMSKET